MTSTSFMSFLFISIVLSYYNLAISLYSLHVLLLISMVTVHLLLIIMGLQNGVIIIFIHSNVNRPNYC